MTDWLKEQRRKSLLKWVVKLSWVEMIDLKKRSAPL
jgi:hypothetical protein